MLPKTKLLCLFFLLVSSKPYLAAQKLDYLLNWRFATENDTNYLAAGTKINLHQNLQAQKKLPQNLFALSDSTLNNYCETTWIYESNFTVKNNLALELLLEGVDCFAAIYVDNLLLMSCNNVFKSYRAKLPPLTNGQHRLRIKFYPTANFEQKKAQSLPFLYPADSDNHPYKTSVFVRKPAYHFGWDFAPRRINYSVQKIKLAALDFSLENLQYSLVKTEGNSAFLQASISINAPEESIQTLFIEGKNITPNKQQVRLTKGTQIISFPVELRNFSYWNFNSPKCYELQLSLSKSGAKFKRHVGVKQFEVIQQEDSIGKGFQFSLNGKKFFAQGLNYIQTETEISEAEVKAWKDAHINVIRVWGGGYYGSEKLYSLCDKYGILIWQDFMFANSMYPADSAFVSNVSEELSQQIKRLRSHPCLALWCGNNEVEVAWKNWGWQGKYNYTYTDSLKLTNDYHDLFKALLPSLVKQNDAGRFYFSSSPISNWGKPQDFTTGDNHYWGVYHGELPIAAYNEHIPRFASEYGMQSYPAMATLQKYFDKDSLYLESEVVKNIQRSYKGNKLLVKYLESYGAPKNFEDFVSKTQRLQADAMYTAITSHRRNAWRCAGSLVWQYNDVWPGASWSLRDVDGNYKAAWYAVKKAFEPLLISTLQNGDSVEVWLINDLETALKTSISYFMNNAKTQAETSKTLTLNAKEGSQFLFRLPYNKDDRIEFVMEYQKDKEKIKRSFSYP